MKTFVLKYGILFLLMTMLIAMALFMNSLELRSKQPAVLIQTGNDFRIYLDSSVPVYHHCSNNSRRFHLCYRASGAGTRAQGSVCEISGWGSGLEETFERQYHDFGLRVLR